jgi:hypothetical protein
MTENYTAVSVRLDEEDAALLEAAQRVEKLTASDLIRRALRHYVREALHLDTPKPKGRGK